MKIKYSVHYDSEVYLNHETELMGTIYAGTQKLLQQLELRAAIPQVQKTDVEREADYLNAMRNHLSGTIFEKAAKVDELGVARKLLQWRDALCMAGWDGVCNNERATKINVLAKIENNFTSNGTPDRWKAIAEAYGEKSILQNIDIEIQCPWEEIPYLVQKTLRGIEQNGGVVSGIVTEEKDENIDISKIQLVDFDDVNDAYEWIATTKGMMKNTLIVNRNNMRLNHILYGWDKPRTSAVSQDSNPQVLQLFKLGMSIFSHPLNIQNVVSYLLLPLSPIPALLRKDLAKLLLKEGGFGETLLREDGVMRDEWDEKINLYEFLNNEGIATPQARHKKMKFLKPIRNDYSNGISKKELCDYVESILSWINGLGAIEELKDEIKQQMHELKALFKSLEITLQTKPEMIHYAELEKLILSIYRPMSYCIQQTEEGAIRIVTDIRQMAEPAEHLIWLDCQEEDIEKDAYDFLSLTERSYLQSKGVVLPDFQLHLKNVRRERVRKINSIQGKVTLVRSTYDGSIRLSEHPLIAEIDQLYKVKKDSLPVVDKEDVLKTAVTTTENQPLQTLQPSVAYELGAIKNLGRKESNSSLDTLINYPFDYVMQYVAKLYQPDDGQVNNTYLTFGNVAHYFFEHIIMDADRIITRIREMVDKEFEQRLNDAINATGLVLRLPENTSELNIFNRQLKDSILALTNIMEKLGLRPVGCEINLPKENETLSLDKIGDFGARIDLLLKDKNDDFVVIDFKWSYSKKYETKLKENIAIQLELYRQAVSETYKDKIVRGVGYYLMPLMQLVTCDFNNITDYKLIRHIESQTTIALIEQIKNSYKFRMKQLKEGHIEEAEELDIKENDRCYYAYQETDNLCPLTTKIEYSGRGQSKQLVSIKKESNEVFRTSKKLKFENGTLEPSEIATKNAILKGRLK